MTVRRNWPFGDLELFGYHALMVDCPWDFRLYSARGVHKSPRRYYETMDTAELAALPVGDLVRGWGFLWSWATGPRLPDAIYCLESWGFRYVTAGAWGKRSPTGKKWNFGTGYVLRSQAEFFCIGVIGSPPYQSKRVPNFIEARVRGHSVKPDEAHDMVEELVPGPYCELFARRPREGWSCWGDQLEESDAAEEEATPAGAGLPEAV